LGNTTAGSSWDNDGINYIQLLQIGTMPSAGTLADIQMYLRGASANDTVQRLVVYNDNAGSAGTNFAVSAEFTVTQSSAAAWYNEAASGSLVNGAVYWAGVWIGTGNSAATSTNFAYSAASPTSKYYSGAAIGSNYASTGPAPNLTGITPSGTASEDLSVYIDYTASGVALAPRSPIMSREAQNRASRW
jgi:hypothetical protein